MIFIEPDEVQRESSICMHFQRNYMAQHLMKILTMARSTFAKVRIFARFEIFVIGARSAL